MEEALSKTRESLQVKLGSHVLEILKKELGNFDIVF